MADTAPVHKFRLGLLGRILLALLLVGLVPLAVVVADRGRIHRSFRDNILRSHIVAARSVAERIAMFVRARRDLAKMLADNPQVYGAPASAAAAEVLAGVLEAQPDVVAICLCRHDGGEYLRAQVPDYAADVGQVLAAEAKAEPQILSGESSAWLRIDVPFSQGDGRVTLVTFAGPLWDFLSPQEIGDQVDQVVLHRDGRVLLGSVSTLADLPPALVQRALVDEQIGSGVFEDSDKESVLGAYFPVAQVPWVVVSKQRTEVAEQQIRSLDLYSALAVGSSLALILLLSAGAYLSVVRPLRRLVQDQRKLIGIPSGEGSTAGNEIQQLHDSLAVLERRVRDKEALDEVFVGRYQVLEVIGEGGMGTVFRAWDPKLQRPVALKTVRLSKEPAAVPGLRRHSPDLLHEAVATARINHPNVVGVFDVVEQEEASFIAMELVDGIALDVYLARCRRLPPAELVPIALAVARGLQAAHGQGIIHHDIKPGNVLLSWDGAIKVVDFGIARFATALAEESKRVFGTPGYLPPEALLGQPYREAGDLFALGVVMYESLTGRRPFLGADLREVLLHTLRHAPLSTQVFAPEVPEALDQVVMDLLEKQPETRIMKVLDLIPRLEALQTEPWDPQRLTRDSTGTVYEKSLSAYCPTMPPQEGATEPPGGTVPVAAELVGAAGAMDTISPGGFASG